MKIPYVMIGGMLVILVSLGVIFWPKASEAPIVEPSPTASATVTASPLASPNAVSTTPNPVSSPTPVAVNPSPAQTSSSLLEPVSEFKQRITKKSFGTKVSPNDSPVQPEKFAGYHTGVDVEYGDVESDVEVKAIADGTVVQSGFVSGYGGVLIIEHIINNAQTYVLYGHIRPSSLVGKGPVTRGQKLGVLGKAYSNETDGERRHLHLSIRKTHSISNKGYVQTQSELSAWYDPLEFYK